MYYNGVPSDDDDVLKASALTSDAAWLFYLGPRALQNKQYAFTRLADGTDDGRNYYRIYSTVQPGFGYSEQDQLVFWIDPDTFLVYRTHMTLNGFRNTRGAHVDVTVREYQQVNGQLLPQRLFERVRGPIAIDVHDWWTTAIELNTASCGDRRCQNSKLLYRSRSPGIVKPLMGCRKRHTIKSRGRKAVDL